MSPLQGKTAIVTGAAVRLGREIAFSLARAGVNICLHYGNSQHAAEATAAEIRQLGVQVELVQADFKDPVGAARQIASLAGKTFSGIDYLINSAAIFEPGTLQDTDESMWERHFAINLKAPFFLSQEFVKLPASGDGMSRAIINIVDWRGTNPVPGHLAYTITKAGLIAQTKILAQELGPGIRVNAIAPGAILPAPDADQTKFHSRGEFNPLRKTGSPQDICAAVLFLLKSSFITGEVIHITGGEHLSAGQRYTI